MVSFCFCHPSYRHLSILLFRSIDRQRWQLCCACFLLLFTFTLSFVDCVQWSIPYFDAWWYDSCLFFSLFFGSAQWGKWNFLYNTKTKHNIHSIFFVCVCLNLVKCENCLRKMTAWDKLLTMCVCKKQKRKENLLFFFLFFLPSDSDVMLLTTNSRILFFFLFWECVGHIFFLYRCYCRIVTGCGIAWRLCRQWQQRMLLLGKRRRK